MVEKRFMKVLMLRRTKGEGEEGNLPYLEIGQVYTVGEKFGRWLCWKQKARPATEADEALAKKTGPITEKDLGMEKAKK